MLTRHAILIPLAVALSGAASTPGGDSNVEHPSAAEIARGYKSFQKITESVVLVNPEFAMLCIGATRKQVDTARARFGPHANTGILIYMNQSAAEAFGQDAVAFPIGAVIVKEKTIGSHVDENGKFSPDGHDGVGGMVKRSPGYDPGNGDWEYFYFEDPKKIESGRIPSCTGCHRAAKDTDYVFGGWRKPA